MSIHYTTKNNFHQTKGRKRPIDSEESSDEDEVAFKQMQLEVVKVDDFDLSFNNSYIQE